MDSQTFLQSLTNAQLYGLNSHYFGCRTTVSREEVISKLLRNGFVFNPRVDIVLAEETREESVTIPADVRQDMWSLADRAVRVNLRSDASCQHQYGLSVRQFQDLYGMARETDPSVNLRRFLKTYTYVRNGGAYTRVQAALNMPPSSSAGTEIQAGMRALLVALKKRWHIRGNFVDSEGTFAAAGHPGCCGRVDLLRIFLSRAPYLKYLLVVVNMRGECFWYEELDGTCGEVGAFLSFRLYALVNTGGSDWPEAFITPEGIKVHGHLLLDGQLYGALGEMFPRLVSRLLGPELYIPDGHSMYRRCPLFSAYIRGTSLLVDRFFGRMRARYAEERMLIHHHTTLRTELAVALAAYFDAKRIAAPLAGHPESVPSRQCTDYPKLLPWERQVANLCNVWKACYTRLQLPLPKVTRSGFETQIPPIDRCRLGAPALE